MAEVCAGKIFRLFAIISLMAWGLGACSEQPLQETDAHHADFAGANALSSIIPVAFPANQYPNQTVRAYGQYQVTTTDNLWEKLEGKFGLGSTSAETPLSVDEPQQRDLWSRMRNGFALPYRNDRRVRKVAQEYAGYRDYLDTVLERAEPYLYYVVSEIDKRGMPTEIALVPIIESAYQPLANSLGGAAGIWQLVLSTGKNYGLTKTFWYDGRRDITASTNAALNYLQKLNAEFDGDWLLTLSAYNSGEATVLRAVKRNRKAGKPVNFWALNLPAETRAYIPRLLAIAALVDHPDDFGVTLRDLPDKPYYASVDLDSQIDLEVAADMAEISHQEIRRLNPGFTHGATDPRGPFQLLLPVNKVKAFTARLATLDYGQRMPESSTRLAHDSDPDAIRSISGESKAMFRNHHATAKSARKSLTHKAAALTIRYTVRAGDSLSRIARHFNISMAQLQQQNPHQFKHDQLKPGRNITLRVDTYKP